MNNQFNLLSIGDANLDVFISPIETETLCKLDEKDCLICFSYGDKIPTKSLDFSVGGNAANNAVGCQRLGVSVASILTLGDDNVGDQVITKLKDEGVNVDFVIRQPSASTNYNTVVNYAGERTIFVYHAPRSYNFPVKLPLTPWVYLTSMGENFKSFYNQLIEWYKKNPQIKLAFNPGTWQLRAGAEGISEILKVTHIIFVNKEEAEKLTGVSSHPQVTSELLLALSRLGPKVCVITDGGNGSYVYNGQRYLKVGILPVDAYERTGAGDSFGSGFLAAIIKGKTYEEALLWGTANSASVIGYIGPQRGLLKESEMQEWMERARSSGVVVQEF